MDLRDYLHHERIKLYEFANKIGYERSYINRISLGTHKPGRRLAKTITEATDGKVTYDNKETTTQTKETQLPLS